MEDIQSKAEVDELNKAQEEIGKAPKKFIPVPKTKTDKKHETKSK